MCALLAMIIPHCTMTGRNKQTERDTACQRSSRCLAGQADAADVVRSSAAHVQVSLALPGQEN